MIGGSPSVGVGAGAAGTYLTAFKSWLQASFTDAPPEVLDLAMAKATAGISARCASLNAEDADIVIIELLHDEPHSTEEVDRVPGVRCDRSPVSLRSSKHSATAGLLCWQLIVASGLNESSWCTVSRTRIKSGTVCREPAASHP